MLMSMQQLLRFFVPLGAQSDDRMPVVNIQYLHLWDDTVPDSDNPLYIISSSCLNQITDLSADREWVFLVREDEPVAEPLLSCKNIHIIRIPAEHGLTKILNYASRIFLHSNNSLECYEQILASVSRPDTVSELAVTVSELTKCPIALIAGTNMIISSCEANIDIKVWNNYLSGRLLKLLKIPDNLTYERFYINPLRTPVEEYEYEVIVPIKSDDPSKQVLGMIYLLCTDPVIPASQANILYFTAYTMSWFFTRYANKDNVTRQPNQQMTFMLMDLLHGIIPTEETFKNVLGHLSFNTNRELVLICIRTSLAAGADNFKLQKNMFLGFFEDSFTFTYAADIFILTPPAWLQPDHKQKQKEFTEALKKTGCYAGISLLFYSIDKYFIHHFSCSLAAADIAIQLKEARRWTDFRAVSLLAIQNNQHASTIHLCDPALIRLVEYDRLHDSDHLYTLSCYWQLNRDIGRICKFLHIHKNTLYYRIRKISTILNQDINDHDNFIQLSLSISILENIKMIPRYRIFDEERINKKWVSISESSEASPI